MINNNFRKSTLTAYNGTQTVLTDGIVSLANSNLTGRSIELNGNSIRLRNSGLYLVNVSVTGTGTAAGDVTISLFEDGLLSFGATGTESVTAATDIANISFSKVIEVDPTCNGIINDKTLTIVNTGVGATLSNIIITVVKLA